MSQPQTEEETHMRGEGWKREITLKYIDVRQGTMVCQEYDFFADRMPCRIKEGGTEGPECGIAHTWMKVVNGKVFWSCYRHKTTQGPIGRGRGVRFAEYPVTATQAMDICKETGQKVPQEAILQSVSEKASGYKMRRPSE